MKVLLNVAGVFSGRTGLALNVSGPWLSGQCTLDVMLVELHGPVIVTTHQQNFPLHFLCFLIISNGNLPNSSNSSIIIFALSGSIHTAFL